MVDATKRSQEWVETGLWDKAGMNIDQSVALGGDEKCQLQNALTSSYSLKDLYILEDSLIGLDDKVSVERILATVRTWGPRIDKLYLADSEKINEYLAHMYGTVFTAKMMVKQGFDVHLIESVSNSGHRVFSDVDILATKDSVLYLIDYTSHNHYESEPFVDGVVQLTGESEILSSKICVLQQIVHCDHESFVVQLVNKRQFDCKIDIPEELGSEYGDGFNRADKIIDLARGLSFGQIGDMEITLSKRVSSLDMNNKLITTLPPLAQIYNGVRALNGLAENKADSMEYYEEIMEHLNTMPTDNAKNSYSRDFYCKARDSPMKPTSYIPLIDRLEYDQIDMIWKNPLEKSRFLVDEILQDKTSVPAILLAMSLCGDGEYHPNEDEMAAWADKVDDQTWGHFRIRESAPVNGSAQNYSFFDLWFDSELQNLDSMAYGSSRNELGLELKKNRDAFKKDNDLTPAEMEDYMEQIGRDFRKVDKPGAFFDTLDNLITDSLGDDDVSKLMKDISKDTLRNFALTKGMSWVECAQQVAEAMSVMPKKAKHYQKLKGNFQTSHSTIYCAGIGDRKGLLISSISYVSDKANNCSFTVVGKLDRFESTGYFVGDHDYYQTRWSDMSRTDLDWYVGAIGTVSTYTTLNRETLMSTSPKKMDSWKTGSDFAIGVTLMLENNTRFSQVSGQVRHLFSNSIGMSNGCADLYKKIDWFKPESFTETMYVLRMHKMTTYLQLLKANKELSRAIVEVESSYIFNKEKYGNKKTAWAVAMPNMSVYLPTDQHLYSSFYSSYAFANNRYNLTFMQAQVFLKQQESRRLYLEYREKPRETDISKLTMPSSTEELVDLLTSSVFNDNLGGKHMPCHLTVLFGTLVSLKSIHNPPDEAKVSELLQDKYPTTRSGSGMCLNSAANNRSSVLDRGVNGILPPRIMKKMIYRKKDGKSVEVETTENQAVKNYESLFMNHHEFVKNELVTPRMQGMESREVSNSEYKEPKRLTKVMMEELLTHTDRLWPTLLHNLNSKASMVARMIHKDDNKPREIAIMNSPLRITALYIEELARTIQRVEIDNGDKTNLIERQDKDYLSSRTYLEYKGKKASGKIVVYDNEDKSGWGPAQDPITIYIVLAMRVKPGYTRDILKWCFSSYATKAFKVPDSLYLTSTRKDGTSLEGKSGLVVDALKSLMITEPKVYERKRAVMYASEGMFQGTLSVASSCGAADCMRLSVRMNELSMSSVKFSSKGHVTSDDSVRAISFVLAEEGEYSTVFSILKRSLTTHDQISRNYSYKRNMSCSVHSQFVYELNSVFYTSDGRIVPSIKSRLSYVTYSHELDLYPSALRCSTTASEYLRIESSVMGAYWVSLLNSFNHLKQFQLLGLYSKLRSDIFKIPLELGGLPTIDPLLGVTGSPLLSIVRNYGGSVSTALTMLGEGKDFDPSNADLSAEDLDEGRLISEMPRISRGKMVSLGYRECKDKRVIRESVNMMDRSIFSNLRCPGSSALWALITCFKREGIYYAESSTANRYAMPQTPKEAEVYRSTSKLFMVPGKDRLNRIDLLELASKWVAGSLTETDRVEKVMGDTTFDLGVCPWPDAALEMQNDYDTYYRIKADMEILKIVPQVSMGHVTKTIVEYMRPDEIASSLEIFVDTHRPREFGGTTEVDPILYLESLDAYESRLKKLAFRNQRMYFTVNPSESGFPVFQKLLATNFMEGSRLVFRGGKQVNKVSLDKVKQLSDFLEKGLKMPFNPIEEMVRVDRVHNYGYLPKRIDLTPLLSAHYIGSDETWGGHSGTNDCIQMLMDRIGHIARSREKAGDAFFFMRRPVMGPHPLRYAGNACEYIQSPVITTTTSAYTQITEISSQPNRKRFTHYRTIWSGDSTSPIDSNTDRYVTLDVSSLSYVPLSIKSHQGMVWAYTGQHKLFLLGKDFNLLTQGILVMQDSPHLINEELVDELFPEESEEDARKKMLALSQLRVGYLQHSEEVPDIGEVPMTQEQAAIASELQFEDPDEFIDAGCEFDLEAWGEDESLETMSDLESLEPFEDEIVEKKVAWEDEDDESVDIGEDLISKLTQGTTVSHSVSLPTMRTIHMLTSRTSLTRLTRPQIARTMKKKRRRGGSKYAWKLVTTFRVETDGFEGVWDTGSENCLLKLIKESDERNKNDEIERLWFRGYIAGVLMKNLETRGSIEAILETRIEDDW